MPRRQAENERIRDEQRQNILHAAERVFARKGLAATKMTEIAAAAEVSYGLAYHYFKNKEELFSALVEHEVRGTKRIIGEIAHQPGTPWERMLALISMMLTGMREQPEAVLVVLQAMTSESTPPEVRQHIIELAQASTQALTKLISEGQQTGEVVAGDPHQLAAVLGATLQGIAMSLIFGSASPTQLPEAALVLRGLKA